MKLLAIAALILAVAKPALPETQPVQVQLRTFRYNFTGGNDTNLYPVARVKLPALLSALTHPKNARDGFAQLITQQWLDATAEPAYQRLLRFFNTKSTPGNLHKAFLTLYKNRSAVLQLLATAYIPSPPNIDEYYEISGIVSGKPIAFWSKRTLRPFLLPFTIAYNGNVRTSYDPKLSQVLAKALKDDDPVKRELDGTDFASSVSSLVWIKVCPPAPGHVDCITGAP